MTLSARTADWRLLCVAGILGFAATLIAVEAARAYAPLLNWLYVVLAALAGGLAAMAFTGTLLTWRVKLSLYRNNLQLNAALNNMNQGLCMFDADNRLVVWNQRYVDMYRIDPKRIWVGCTIRDLLDARIAAGTFPLDPAQYDTELRAALKQRQGLKKDIALDDGRVIAVVNQPMENGGWVATHEDMTERKRAERDLEQTRSFLDTVIENVPSPIIVKDVPRLRYVLINRAAEKYLGVDRQSMLGRTTREVVPSSTAATIDAEDQKMVAAGRTMQFDEKAIATPGNGTRIVTSTRLPIFGADGKPHYLISLINDLTEHKRDEQRIAHMAHHDTLTDLPNRAAFNECLGATIDLAAIAKENFALISVDLDGFTAVNDVFGHSTGDALLREIAVRMLEACQGAFLARMGGDEFAVITPTGPQPASAEALAERIVQALDADIDIEGHRLHVGVTIGVAVYPQDGADATSLVANADAALFRAKAEARGSIRFFEMAMDREVRDKRALQQDLRSAIAHNEIALHYQPQAQIDGTITGFEALVRWHHPTRGDVPPSVFIPLAEESGIIVALGEWILRAAAREAASWPRPLTIAINLSPVQFHHGDLASLVHQVLLETGLAPGRLELEITEGMLIGEFNRVLSVLRRLKNLGVHIAMDDFGTGYSSLSYLHSFPFDKIKIDQAFVVNLNRNQQSATIIRAVIALGHGLALPVVAEGVETEEQLKFLASESCDGIQGYYAGRPKPIAEYAEVVGRAPFGKNSKIAIAS
jgi:diguanylate cyclase (GGDEF)-like protein/PAS domain S-box-containing protein